MIITRDNLNEVLFENHDARLLIQEVVTNTSANLYYYHDVEISVRMAIDIYNRAHKADEEERFYSVSFLDGLAITPCQNRTREDQRMCQAM